MYVYINVFLSGLFIDSSIQFSSNIFAMVDLHLVIMLAFLILIN